MQQIRKRCRYSKPPDCTLLTLLSSENTIYLDDTGIIEDCTNMVTMDVGQVNNVIIKVKSLLAVDDVTPTDGVLTELLDGVENIIREGTTELSMFANLPRIFRTSLLLQKTTESAQHSMNETIIATNRSFLIEELSTLALVRAYTDKGITCFDGLDGTLGRQQRAEGFLTILKKNNLVDSLFDILLEQDMICVLDRLNNCRNAYSADPQILRRNILNNLTNILANVDIDDVREIFIEREVLSSSIFDEIENRYSQTKDQMIAMIAIIKSVPRAMRTLVDVLYINQLDSLADSLLRRTPNEMQDNTQTDEEFMLDYDDEEFKLDWDGKEG